MTRSGRDRKRRRDFTVLATDLDNTILRADGRMPRAIMTALTAVRKSGVRIVLCSGRMVVTARPFHTRLKLDTPLIAYNGAMVVDKSVEKPLMHCPVPNSAIAPIAEYCRERELQLNFYWNDKLFCEQTGPLLDAYCRKYGVDFHLINDLAHMTVDPTKLTILCKTPEAAQTVVAEVRARHHREMTINTSVGTHVEITRWGVHKGIALQFVLEKMKVDPADVVAMGDGLNDLELIQAVGYGVGVAPCGKELRAAVDEVLPSVDEAGPAAFLMEVAAAKC